MANTPALNSLLTPADAADILQVSVRTLTGLADAGKLRYILVGKRRRFALEDLTKFVNDNRREGSCQSTKEKARRSITTISAGKVFDFAARLERQAKERR